ncbi:MAG: 50S ribosomal protein L18e [Candidatus Woesearchaeota archaeon]
MEKTKNLELQKLLKELKIASIQNQAKIWKRIANDLEKSTRSRREVNVFKLAQTTKENDVVIVPGKVLGTGDIDHKITVAAYAFSKQAQDKINKKGKAITLTDLLKENPKGKKIKIIG